ncbi:MAG: hypothetical protein ACOYOK_10350 [Pseudobdellovibrionaceae bacterium]
MERYKVSGEDLRKFYQEDVTLFQVFQDIENDLRAQKKVVCQYVINGQEVAEENECLFARWTLDKIETLEYLSESIMSLVEEVGQAWIHALPEMITNCEKLSIQIKNNQMHSVLKPFYEFLQNCEYFVHSLISIRGILGDSLAGFPFDWNKTSEKSLKIMASALTALEKKEFNTLSLLFEYDLPQNLQDWLENLYQMEDAFYGGPFVERKSLAAPAAKGSDQQQEAGAGTSAVDTTPRRHFMDLKRYQN